MGNWKMVRDERISNYGFKNRKYGSCILWWMRQCIQNVLTLYSEIWDVLYNKGYLISSFSQIHFKIKKVFQCHNPNELVRCIYVNVNIRPPTTFSFGSSTHISRKRSRNHATFIVHFWKNLMKASQGKIECI